MINYIKSLTFIHYFGFIIFCVGIFAIITDQFILQIIVLIDLLMLSAGDFLMGLDEFKLSDVIEDLKR